MGKPIPAIASGKVVRVFNNNKTAGNAVEVQAPDGTVIRYLHMKDAPTLKVGQTVGVGMNIGNVGSTGRSTGAHLHLQAVKNGKNVDPMRYMGMGGSSQGASKQTGSYKPSSYTDTWKTRKEASKSSDYKTYYGHIQQAVNKGLVSPNDAVLITELIGRESTWNPRVKNKEGSSAWGYGQFMPNTRREWEKKTGLNYNDPIHQIGITAAYAKGRYGSVEKALQFWDKNNWY